ncbi:MAG: hypothetical protein ABGZ17_19880, partial [Planctomycetaceae bacterium]
MTADLCFESRKASAAIAETFESLQVVVEFLVICGRDPGLQPFEDGVGILSFPDAASSLLAVQVFLSFFCCGDFPETAFPWISQFYPG